MRRPKRFLRGFTVVAVALLGAGAGAEAPPSAPSDADATAMVLGAALTNDGAYRKLEHLTDRIGHRLSGSEALGRAVAWAERTFREDGADRVWTEPVDVPVWVRGEAWGRITAPVEQPLVLLALGMSVATPEEGLEAEVVEVDGFPALQALGEEGVRGRIVLYNRAMRPEEPGRSYGETVRLRWAGAVQAAKLGAVGVLIRSLGTADFRLPHTGSMGYEDGVPKIPAAAVSSEDAELIHRLLQSGETVRVRYRLGCRTLPDAPSANVLAEIRGREKPDEIVLIGAHLDSWDVGTGALDDGAGVAIVMETLHLLRRLDLRPRRTIRAVLFTNEENGLRGGRDYARRHRDELSRHVAAVESDAGAGPPLGFRASVGEGGVERLQAVADLLRAIGAGRVATPGGGADIGPMRPAGVPLIGLWQDTTHYFDYHHTMADTLDKVDPENLRKNLAVMAVLAYQLAEMEPLPRLEVSQDAEGSR